MMKNLSRQTLTKGYNKNYQQMRLFVLCLYFLFSRLFPTCFEPSWAHHREGCIQPPDNNDGLSTIYSV